MSAVSITFRDITSYLIPGGAYLLFFWLMANIFFDLQLLNYSHSWGVEALLLIFLTLSAYVFGVIVEPISVLFRKYVIRKINLFKDPILYYYDAVKPHPDGSLKAIGLSLLGDQLNISAVKAMSGTEITYFFIRYAELKSVSATSFLMRINSLCQLCNNLVLPVVLFVLFGVYYIYVSMAPDGNEGMILISILSLIAVGMVLVVLLVKANVANRNWLARTALRYYVILRLNDVTQQGHHVVDLRSKNQSVFDALNLS